MSIPLQHILSDIAKYESKYHRPLHSIKLLAVSKGQSIEKIRAASELGQKAFGESYLQEALEKIAMLPHLEWHFIGPIQSNKTRKIAENFAWVQSVAEMKIAQRLNDQRPTFLPPLQVCIQVNISQEATKSGLTQIEDLIALATFCLTLPNITLRGLMSIPAHSASFVEQCDQFRKVKQIFDQLNELGFELDTLSMGMSDDFEAAIAEGTTCIRIGQALFGERK